MRRSFAVILLLTFLPASHAQLESSRDEATLKALFIYTFTKHIEWPEANNPNKQFVITILAIII
ncbi:MAG: hypothetical protein IPP51_16145 [Bacteroidetes bacterium]|nr:hypothetical protein [Bacteroidota bacterium]